MEEKKELSEILLGSNKRTSNGKKAVLVVLAAIAIIVIAAFLMWKFLSTKEEPLATPSGVIDTEIMKPADDQFSGNLGGFDFQQDGSSKPDNKIDDIYGGLPQDFTLGFDEQGAQDQQSQSSPTSEIDDVLNNITGSMKPESKPESKEPAQASQPATSPQAQKPAPQAPTSKDTKDSEAKKPEPQPATKPESKPEPKEPATKPAPRPAAPAQKPSTPAPQATNGSAPTQGFYWQIGAFEREPSAEFLTLIKKYSYRIQRVTFDNKPNARYLLGPYKSRSQAPNREEIAEIFKENPIPVEIP